MSVSGGSLTSWERLQRLPEQQIQQLYGAHMPIEVRRVMSDWIDKQNWTALNPDNPEVNQYLPVLVQQFMRELEDQTNKEVDFSIRHKLVESLSQFKATYGADPSMLIRVLRNCVICEQKLLTQYESAMATAMAGMSQGGQPQVSSGGTDMNNTVVTPMSISHDLEECRRNAQHTIEQFHQMQQLEKRFFLEYQDLQMRTGHLQQLQMNGSQHDVLQRAQQDMAKCDAVVKERARELQQARIAFTDKFKNSVLQLSYLEQHIVGKQLINWHRAQQLAGNGQPFENNLDQIQEWCEILLELTLQHLQMVTELEMVISQIPTSYGATMQESLTLLKNQIKALLSALVCGTFVVEKQPPQVMKTNTRFTSTVRLLIGGQHIRSSPQVQVSIVSEAQAGALARNDGYPLNEVSGEILNNIGFMEYHQATKQLAVSFRTMSLKKIKRAEKKGTESVMDEKFCLLFQSKVKVGDLEFSVQAQSLPVVVIVHGNQEPHAWATITWDNAFSDPQRYPFVIPERIPWSKMAHVLSTKFRSATGRGLSESDLHFLATKVFRNANLGNDIHNLPLSWTHFCKEPLPDRSFTFWEWFYAIMKVTREHLRPLWNDRVLWGFVSRREAEDLLLKKANGTFLLRFSDSELGGVSIAWVTETEGIGKEILMVQPFTSRDFQIRSLADRMSDLQNLVYLYPDVVKDQAFGKYYTTAAEHMVNHNTNGYVKPMLITQIPGLQQSGSCMLDSNPGTPQPYYAHSESNGMYNNNNNGMGGSGQEGAFGELNAMQLYALAQQSSGHSLKRLREDDFCSLQQPQQVTH